MEMTACTACDAFVPRPQTSCPSCETPVRRSWLSRATSLFKAAGGGAIAVTLMACYGAPAYHDEVVTPTEETEPDVMHDEAAPEEEEGEDSGGQ